MRNRISELPATINTTVSKHEFPDKTAVRKAFGGEADITEYASGFYVRRTIPKWGGWSAQKGTAKTKKQVNKERSEAARMNAVGWINDDGDAD